MGPLIRLASSSDLKAVAELNAEVQQLHVASRPDQFKSPQLSELEQWFSQLLQNPAAKVWVADISSVPVAYAVILVREGQETPFSPARKWWNIDQLGVQAAHRRNGIARALIGKIISEARAHDVAELELSSWAFNQNAHAVFASLGFVPKVVRFELNVSNYEPDARQ